MQIKIGDIVCFRTVYKIGIDDLIRAQSFTKYMIVLNVIESVKGKPACKVMCANGEINWVAMSQIKNADE